MREMDIQPFPRPITFTDLDQTLRTRLNQTTVLWPQQAIALLTYMAHPNDPAARASLADILQGWTSDSPVVPHRLRQMQLDWSRLADILNHHHDLHEAKHQPHRGGASVSKSIAVVSAGTKSKGASEANLWEIWRCYSDVAPVIAAATFITLEARWRMKAKPLGQFGMRSDQLQPFLMTMMLPDLVLSVGLSLQDYGLAQVPHGHEQPMLNPNTLWRIPPDMNISPLPPPVRELTKPAIAMLKARRAGNRGKWARTG